MTANGAACTMDTLNLRTATRACPVCLEAAVRQLCAQRFALPHGHPLCAGYDVVACEACGFVYADTAATQRDYDVFYAQMSKYESGGTATGSGEESWDAERLQTTAECIARQVRDRHGRILDVGCANGGLLVALRGLGYTSLYGLDPSAVCVQNVRAKGIEACQKTLDNDLSALGSFDAIVLSHVLEHICDVRQALRTLQKLLSPQGILYVEVPDAMRYAEYYISPFHFFDTEHINHFSARSLHNALRLAGLTPFEDGHKETPVTLGVPYPAVWVSSCLGAATGYERDEMLEPAIRKYIQRSRDDFDTASIDRLVDSGQPLIIWGVGCSTLRILSSTSLRHANIVAFVDNNSKFWNTTVEDKPVLPPSALAQRSESIVITSKLYASQIRRQIEDELGLPNTIVQTFT